MLGERIALRLVEDVTVDACVKEGEDELLCNLTISDDGNAANGQNRINAYQIDHGP